MTAPDDIDRLLLAPKRLVGRLAWIANDAGTTSTLTAPVAIDVLTGSMQFEAKVTLHTDPQRGGAVLIYEGRPIQRINIRPGHAHANPVTKRIPADLRGLRFGEESTRVHLWEHNRAWPRGREDNVTVASRVDPEAVSVRAALGYFLTLCGIVADLPEPPWRPRLI